MQKILKILRRANQNNCFRYKTVMDTVITQLEQDNCFRYKTVMHTVITQLEQDNPGMFHEGSLKDSSEDSQGTNTKIYGL